MSDDDEHTLRSSWKKDAGTSFMTIASIALCMYKTRKTVADFWLLRTLSNPGVIVPEVTAVLGLGSIAYFSLYRVMVSILRKAFLDGCLLVCNTDVPIAH